MKIERLELVGYIRLMPGVSRFVYTPSTTCQIILGTNGSGKSSILYELSPLPASKGEYIEGGFKRIEISHKGAHYVLESSFKHGNKHSFTRDGEDLNPGGTGAVQKELVKREFGYTAELHELLIGQTRFTELAPLKRRDWITRMDSVDYTYSLGIYQKLKSLTRDHQGTLKHLKQRLVVETNNLKMLSDTEGMEERSHLLHQELNLLLANRLPNLPTLHETQTQLSGLIQRIEQLSNTVINQKVPVPKGKRYQGMDDVSQDLTQLEMQVNTQQSLLNRTTTEYSELETVVSKFTQNGQVTIENVEGHILECEQMLESLRDRVQMFHGVESAEDARRDTLSILDEVIALFQALPDNTDRRYSTENMEQAKAEIATHDEHIDRASTRLNLIIARLQTINAAKDTNCPSCGYVWREGYSEGEVFQNETWRGECVAIIEEAQRRIAVQRTYLDEAQQVAAQYRQFRTFASSYPRLRLLWDHLLQNNLLTNNPSGQLHVFNIWQRDVEVLAQIAEWERKLTHLRELEERQSQLGGASHLTLRLSTLTTEIEEMTQALVGLRQDVRDVRQYRDRMFRVVESAQSLESLVADLERTQSTMINALRNRHIDNAVNQHQHELAEITRKLTDKRSVEGIVQDLETSHTQVDLDYQSYHLLAKCLSPEDGLIAEQLSGFIGCLVAQLNSVIAAVWTYEMKVLACGIDSGELDYKFPMEVRQADHEVSDISKGSKGMQAMVNMAFQLTAMLYLGLEDYPLFLDEPGEGFDEQHRIQLMSFIKQLLDSGRYSQLFMISHYATSHGAFTGAEVLVLDGTNIAVPANHNQHVVLG